MTPAQGRQRAAGRLAGRREGAAHLVRPGGETLTILTLAEVDDHVGASPSLYGRTYNLLRYTLPRYGNRCPLSRTRPTWGHGSRPSGPTPRCSTARRSPAQVVEVLDIEDLADLAHSVDVPVVVDNTVATRSLPGRSTRAWTSSWTRRSTSAGTARRSSGGIVYVGRFDYAADPAKFPPSTPGTRATTGWVYAHDLGVGLLREPTRFHRQARVKRLRDLDLAPGQTFQRVPHRAGAGYLEPAHGTAAGPCERQVAGS